MDIDDYYDMCCSEESCCSNCEEFSNQKECAQDYAKVLWEELSKSNPDIEILQDCADEILGALDLNKWAIEFDKKMGRS